MDGALAVLVVVIGGLIAWRWWLVDKAATRLHEMALRQAVVVVDQKALDALPARIGALEEELKGIRWKKA